MTRWLTINWLKRAMVLVGAVITLTGAATGVVTAIRAGWAMAKTAGSEEKAREVRLQQVEGDTKNLKTDVQQLKDGLHATGSRLQRIEDSQDRAEEAWREVKDELKEMRRRR